MHFLQNTKYNIIRQIFYFVKTKHKEIKMYIVTGLLIPFIGTTFGAAMVFFMKNTMNKKTEKLLLGFASGVMIAASVWSLLIPSIEMSEENRHFWMDSCKYWIFIWCFLFDYIR